MNVKAKIILGVSSIMIIMFFIFGISAASLSISNSTGVVKIDFSSTGNINASGTIAENGILLSNIYLKLVGGSLTGVISSNSNITTSAHFVGNGSFLTGITATVSPNSTTLYYTNITGTPTCTSGQYVLMNATGWICSTPSTYNATYNALVTFPGYTNIALTNTTNIFTANQNMSDKNITTVDCIIFNSGGKICDSA